MFDIFRSFSPQKDVVDVRIIERVIADFEFPKRDFPVAFFGVDAFQRGDVMDEND